jgi:uncharacterized protein
MTTLPLFPLGTVLFPGGVLPLRIFEPRYMDMVKTCLRDNLEFGVILLTTGSEVANKNAPASQHESIGTSAKIIDFDMQQLGLLLIRTRGGRRFRVLSSRTDTNQLVHADVQWIEDDDVVAPTPDLDATVSLLKNVIAQAEEKQPELDKRMILAPYHYDDCSWVANRLCEVLPIPASTKYKLMALEDPVARLRLVLHYLQQQKVVS